MHCCGCGKAHGLKWSLVHKTRDSGHPVFPGSKKSGVLGWDAAGRPPRAGFVRRAVASEREGPRVPTRASSLSGSCRYLGTSFVLVITSVSVPGGERAHQALASCVVPVRHAPPAEGPQCAPKPGPSTSRPTQTSPGPPPCPFLSWASAVCSLCALRGVRFPLSAASRCPTEPHAAGVVAGGRGLSQGGVSWGGPCSETGVHAFLWAPRVAGPLRLVPTQRQGCILPPEVPLPPPCHRSEPWSRTGPLSARPG